MAIHGQNLGGAFLSESKRDRKRAISFLTGETAAGRELSPHELVEDGFPEKSHNSQIRSHMAVSLGFNVATDWERSVVFSR